MHSYYHQPLISISKKNLIALVNTNHINLKIQVPKKNLVKLYQQFKTV